MIMLSTLTFLSSICYVSATFSLILKLMRRITVPKSALIILGGIAVCLHAILLYHWIDQQGGHDLSPWNLCSQMLWLVASLILVTALFKPIENLLLLVFPLTLVSLLAAAGSMNDNTVLTQLSKREMIHVLWSLLAVSAVCATMLQSVLFALQQWLLRRKQIVAVLQVLPPLQTMETFLYQLIWISVVLLSIVIATSLWFFGTLFTLQLWTKSLLVLLSWAVLVGLLIGRYAFGWRDITVVRMTTLGFFSLLIAYMITLTLS